MQQVVIKILMGLAVWALLALAGLNAEAKKGLPTTLPSKTKVTKVTTNKASAIAALYSADAGFCGGPESDHFHVETYYLKRFCDSRGEQGTQLDDGSLIHCLAPDFVVQVGFANKWAELFGQSLHNSLVSRRAPAVALIIERQSDYEYLKYVKEMREAFGLKMKIYAVPADEVSECSWVK